MRTIKALFFLLSMGFFVTTSYGQLLIVQRLFNIIDPKFHEELNDVDFSQDELKKLKAFIHQGIESKSSEELNKNFHLILKNTESLLDHYQEENTTCKADQETLDNDNYAQINQDCFRSTIKNICPLYPFC